MVKILNNNKRVFWEALLLTVVVFFLGMLIGMSFEMNKVNEIKDYYSYSEISMMDIFVLNNLLDLNKVSCGEAESASFDFADRIYGEARLLERYESSGKITESMLLEHKKYDTLRTFLWINEMKTVEKCGRNFNTIVYLYEYQPEDLAQKATQNVWAKVLYDLKTEYGNEVLLVPVAVDSDIISLNSIINGYNITKYPVLVIDNKEIVSELSSVEQLRKYIN